MTDLMGQAATEWLRLISVPSETETEDRAFLCTVSYKLAQLIQLSGLILHFWTCHILHCFHSQVLFLGTEQLFCSQLATETIELYILSNSVRGALYRTLSRQQQLKPQSVILLCRCSLNKQNAAHARNLNSFYPWAGRTANPDTLEGEGCKTLLDFGLMSFFIIM